MLLPSFAAHQSDLLLKDTRAMSYIAEPTTRAPSPWAQLFFKQRLFHMLTDAQVQQIEEHALRRTLLDAGALLATGDVSEQRATLIVRELVALVGSPVFQQRTDVVALLERLPQRWQMQAAHLLSSAVRNTQSHMRWTAIVALGGLGYARTIATPIMIASLTNSDIRVRTAAVESLAQARNDDVLASALNSTYADVRVAAAQAIGHISQTTSASLRALAAALRHTDEAVQCAAAEMVVQTSQAVPEVVAALGTALNSRDASVRGSSAHALVRLDQATAAVRATLVTILDAGERRSGEDAAMALGELGAIDTLIEALQHESAAVRALTVRALGDAAHSTPEIIEGLIAALRDSESHVRAAAAEALGQRGQTTPGVVSALLSALRDGEWPVRRAAARALGQLGQATPTVIEALIATLRDGFSPFDRQAIVESLGQLRQATPPVLGALTEALHDTFLPVRTAAARALWQLGQPAASSIEVLIDVLTNARSSDDRCAAARILGEIGQAPPEALHILASALQDDDSDVRAAAATTLGKLAVVPRQVRLMLLAALDDHATAVSDAAYKALMNNP